MKYEKDFSEVESKFNLDYGDLVVVAYANSYKLAEQGALSVAVDLNKDLKSLMNNFK